MAHHRLAIAALLAVLGPGIFDARDSFAQDEPGAAKAPAPAPIDAPAAAKAAPTSGHGWKKPGKSRRPGLKNSAEGRRPMYIPMR